MPAAGIAVAGYIGIFVAVVAHFLLGKAVAGAVVAQVALDVQRMLRLFVGHVEVALAICQVGKGVADRRVGEDDISLPFVHVADVLAVLLVEESPLVAHLFGGPDEAVILLVEVGPIDIDIAPFGGEVLLLACHSLGLASSGAVELAAVADDVELVALLDLAQALDPGVGSRNFHRSHLFVGKRRFPECHLAHIGVRSLAILVAEQIEAPGVKLEAAIRCFVVNDFLAVHIELGIAIAHGIDDAVPSVVPDAAIVASQITAESNLTLADEEFSVVGVIPVGLENGVIDIGVGHLHVEHESVGHGGTGTLGTLQFHGSGLGHEDCSVFGCHSVGRHNACLVDGSCRDAVVAQHGGAQCQTALAGGQEVAGVVKFPLTGRFRHLSHCRQVSRQAHQAHQEHKEKTFFHS